MKIEKRNLNDLIPAEYNPRLSTPEQEENLKKSLEKFGVVEPIILNDRSGNIVGGHFRVRELKKLGKKSVECVIVDLDPEDEKELNIRLNANTGDWDWAKLSTWDQAKLAEWGIESIETDDDDIKVKDDSYKIPEEIKTSIVLGDLIEIGKHRLLCGSSTEAETWEKLMMGNKCDMIMTDPPYNVDYTGETGLKIMNDKKQDDDFYKFLFDFYTNPNNHCKDGGAWYVWHADREGANFRQAMKDAGILLRQCLIWVKNSLVLGSQDYHWKHEPCLYGWKPGESHYFIEDRSQTTVIEQEMDLTKMKKDQLIKIIDDINSENLLTTIIQHDKPQKNGVHPTMKPITLLGPLIMNSSKQGEIVCDGFLGSGSTLLASEQTNRICYGMEMDPKYCQVIVDRIKEYDENLIIKKNGEPI